MYNPTSWQKPMEDKALYKKFPTGSVYFGAYNTALHDLDGFGTYTYPDGSQYEGYFRQGLFNGYGQLCLSQPYPMKFVGNFVNGKLTTIHDIRFYDGLLFDLTEDPATGGINTEIWKYLTERDRRYRREYHTGLTAKAISAPNGELVIPVGAYHTGEGVYKPETGFMKCLGGPKPRTRFVNCAEADWIKKKCPHGGKVFRGCPLSKCGTPVDPTCCEIIENNQNSVKQLAGIDDNFFPNDCSCNFDNKSFGRLLNDPLSSSPSSLNRCEYYLTSSEISRDSVSSLTASLERNIKEVEAVTENAQSATESTMADRYGKLSADNDLKELQKLLESYRGNY